MIRETVQDPDGNRVLLTTYMKWFSGPETPWRWSRRYDGLLLYFCDEDSCFYVLRANSDEVLRIQSTQEDMEIAKQECDERWPFWLNS